LKNNFIDQVSKDVVWPIPPAVPGGVSPGDAIYGLPLTVDTLVMYYNKDLLNSAGIPEPPNNWKTFQESMRKLVKLDREGNILVSGAAIGTGANVERAGDILSLLMMQNGAKMTDDYGYATFNAIPPELSGTRTESPGLEALTFLPILPRRQRKFTAGTARCRVPLMPLFRARPPFSSAIRTICPNPRQAPKLNLGIARAPQIEGNPEINFANYWVYSVVKRANIPMRPGISWNI